MPTRLILLLLLFLSLSVNILQWRGARSRNTVTSVPDGDSLDLADGRRVRLLGIDAPERGRCMADEARAFLTGQAKGRSLRLKETFTDDYGRTLGIAIVESPSVWFSYLRTRFSMLDSLFSILDSPPTDPLLQRALVSAGLARNRSSVSNPYHQVLTDAQETAKSAKLGIWSEECRGDSSGRQDCLIKGNTRAGKKQYYLPDCPNYPDVLVDTAFGDRWFCSESEAQSAGFTKSSGCPGSSP